MRKLLVAIVVFMLAGSVSGQDLPKLSFRGNWMGMTLAEFAVQNQGKPIVLHVGGPSVRGPFCTDQYDLPVAASITMAKGEVICDVGFPAQEVSDLSVGGIEMSSILYRFWNNRLYSIDLAFDSSKYEDIFSIFTKKYGASRFTNEDRYENAFGTKWIGHTSIWTDGNQFLRLQEGSGNGPGQSGKSSTAIYLDAKFGPPAKDEPKIDF